MTPARGRCLVRKVETAESYAGSTIVLPAVVREKIAAHQVEIVAVGAPSICDAPDCEHPHEWIAHDRGTWGMLPLHVCGARVGDWVLVAPRSLVECGDPTAQTYLCNQDDVLAILSA